LSEDAEKTLRGQYVNTAYQLRCAQPAVLYRQVCDVLPARSLWILAARCSAPQPTQAHPKAIHTVKITSTVMLPILHAANALRSVERHKQVMPLASRQRFDSKIQRGPLYLLRQG
jgi:hypothetical protein